ncbi:MAG: glycosyltransferase family 1 protein, partial [Betaproteobacteria bacterium]
MNLSDSLNLARLRISAWTWAHSTASRQRTGGSRHFSPGARRKLLLVSRPDPICQSQIFPFHFYRRALYERWGYEVLEIGLATLLAEPDKAPKGADVVCFQAWIDQTPQDQRAIVALLRQQHPAARIALLDPCAPTDLRFAAAVGSEVDFYVKKHVLRDLGAYDRPTRGDTNLSDWYGAHYGDRLPESYFELPPGFKDKLLVGPSFVTAPYMLP